eukprot:6464501-Amphidinium_carterae.1
MYLPTLLGRIPSLKLMKLGTSILSVSLLRLEVNLAGVALTLVSLVFVSAKNCSGRSSFVKGVSFPSTCDPKISFFRLSDTVL